MDLTRELMSLFAAVLMVSIVVGLMTVVVAPTHITEEQCSMPIRNHGGYATVSCWLGFGFNSTLGYPGEGPPIGLQTPLEAEVWLQQVEEQKILQIRGTKIQMCTKHPRCRLGPCAAVARPVLADR